MARSRLWLGVGCGLEEGVGRSGVWSAGGCGQEEGVARTQHFTASRVLARLEPKSTAC